MRRLAGRRDLRPTRKLGKKQGDCSSNSGSWKSSVAEGPPPTARQRTNKPSAGEAAAFPFACLTVLLDMFHAYRSYPPSFCKRSLCELPADPPSPQAPNRGSSEGSDLGAGGQ